MTTWQYFIRFILALLAALGTGLMTLSLVALGACFIIIMGNGNDFNIKLLFWLNSLFSLGCACYTFVLVWKNYDPNSKANRKGRYRIREKQNRHQIDEK